MEDSNSTMYIAITPIDRFLHTGLEYLLEISCPFPSQIPYQTGAWLRVVIVKGQEGKQRDKCIYVHICIYISIKGKEMKYFQCKCIEYKRIIKVFFYIRLNLTKKSTTKTY